LRGRTSELPLPDEHDCDYQHDYALALDDCAIDLDGSAFDYDDYAGGAAENQTQMNAGEIDSDCARAANANDCFREKHHANDSTNDVDFDCDCAVLLDASASSRLPDV
jgi:hypothetical protein